MNRRALGLLLLLPLGSGCRSEGARKPGSDGVRAAASAPRPSPAGSASARFVDLALEIVEHQREPDGVERLRARGAQRESPLSLRVELGGSWRPENVGADIAHVVCRGSVTFLRDGAEGDALLVALDDLYATHLGPLGQAERTELSARTPCAGSREPAAGPRSFKLAWDPADARAYAELELTLDEGAHRLELRETDPAYRAALIRALGRF